MVKTNGQDDVVSENAFRREEEIAEAKHILAVVEILRKAFPDAKHDSIVIMVGEMKRDAQRERRTVSSEKRRSRLTPRRTR